MFVIFTPSFISHFGYNQTISLFSHSVNTFFDIFSKKLDKLAKRLYLICARCSK
nr:MAG TPA: hypothetical protein [Caudoviricetes sp.]